MNSDPRYLTTREVADLLRIKERKVYDLASSGELPCTKAIGKLLFPRDQIESWLSQNTSAGDNALAARRPDVFLGSHDPLLDWAIRESRCGLATLFDSSSDGLDRFEQTGGIATGLHLPGAAGDGWNTDAVNGRFARAPVVLVEWAKRSRGLVLREGLDKAPGSLRDARGLRLVPRQPEAGAQVFFEQLLTRDGLVAAEFDMLAPARSENDVVQAVSAGRADIGFALASVAHDHKLTFLPLAKERFDILVDRRAWFEPAFRALWEFCRTPDFAARARELSGYDLAGFGTVHFNGA